ncbi:transcription initiation factor TFIID subunit 12 [Dorcoceras hygrometricum]|uniref:Transcription initiation factor TFIID subunit 12 n=1 Tax=Dorcoceras hygrometricum TaxID=472368 RepID=A0A2Z7CPG5_9LAMI|nr:transcription initiation factor TFIID subunit 12 [Dorcoceras hygrometricum]
MESTPSTPQSTDQQPPQQNPQPSSPAAASSTPVPITTTVSSPNPNPSNSQPTSSQTRPTFNTRPWQQPTSPYGHFSLPPPPSLSSSSASTSSITAPPPSFSSLAPPSFAQQSQVRQPMQGMQGLGVTGSLGTTSSVRPSAGVPAQQFRPPQSPQRPQIAPSSQSPASQNFQGHGILRASSLGSSTSQSPSNAQGTQAQNQPWLSSGTQGKPPLPSPSIRPQTTPQSFQQRPHITQQHHNMPATSHKQMINSSQQVAQPSASGQQLEHHGQQLPSSRIQPPSSHQQQLTKSPGLGGQRPPLGMAQSAALQSGSHFKTTTFETEEVPNRVVSKRSIQELVNQIDPSEKLDPEVEDILVDLAEDFVESITTFGCSLAKHRKSTTLEAKDILLPLERNWNMTIPGFGGDEIRTYKKPFITDIHRERLAMIKKSIVAAATQTGGKGHMSKAPSSIIGSPPKPKTREAA